jgi:hypothetical protein
MSKEVAEFVSDLEKLHLLGKGGFGRYIFLLHLMIVLI